MVGARLGLLSVSYWPTRGQEDLPVGAGTDAGDANSTEKA